MLQVTIQWTNPNKKQLNSTQNVDFLAISNGRRLLHVSHLRSQDVAGEFRKICHQLNLRAEDLKVWLGGLSLSAKASTTMLQLQAVEHILVQVHNPMFNIPVKSMTSAWEKMTIQNLGFGKLYKHIRFEDGRIFRRQLGIKSNINWKRGKSFSLQN